jgi:hypothetical protein
MPYILEGARQVAQLLRDGTHNLDDLIETYPECRDSQIADNEVMLLFYFSQRLEGVAHAWAAMTACQQSASAVTDRELFENIGTLDKQFSGEGGEAQLNHLASIARSHGYNPGIHDMYSSALARFEGDPEAFIPATGGRGHIKAICEQRNWSCDGMVKTNADLSRHEEGTPSGKHLDPVRSRELAMVEKMTNPDAQGSSIDEIAQTMKQRHGMADSDLFGQFENAPDIKPAFTSKDLKKTKRKKNPRKKTK